MVGIEERPEESLSCAVCEEAFDGEVHQPVALPGCGHTFCRPCIKKLKSRSHVFQCPTCRHSYEGLDITRLPTNFLVLELLPSTSQKEEEMVQSEDVEDFTSIKKEKVNSLSMDDKYRHTLDNETMDYNSKEVNIGKHNRKAAGSEMKLNIKNIVSSDCSGVYRREDQPEDEQDILPEYGPLVYSDITSNREGSGNSVWYRDRRIWLLFVVFLIVLAAVGCGVALGCSMDIINQMGFTSTGIARKSYASRWMSSTARSNNGVVPPESWVAWLQNIGHKGFTPKHQAIIGLLGALACAVVGALLFWIIVSVCLMVHCCRSSRTGHHVVTDRGFPLTTTQSCRN